MEVDVLKLPWDVRQKLAQLDLELAEGDITQKGHEKKKAQLVAPFLPGSNLGSTNQASPGTRAQRRHQRRVTRDENRYHSEIRVEAVQQALAQIAKAAPNRPSVPAPVKRPSNNKKDKFGPSGNANRSDTSSDDDDSLLNSSGDSGGGRKRHSRPHSCSSPPQGLAIVGGGGSSSNGGGVGVVGSSGGGGNNNSSSDRRQNDLQKRRSPKLVEQHQRPPPPDVTTSANISLQNLNNKQQQTTNNVTSVGVNINVKDHHNHHQININSTSGSTKIVSSTTTTPSPLGNVNQFSSENNLYQNTQLQGDYQNAILKPAKVSQKIQQLLNTLQRPKKKPLQEYYNDDDAELEAMAKAVDPSAPKPEGAIISPARGESIQLPASLPRSLDSALQRFGSANHRLPVATVLDASGRPVFSLTYGKLLSRANKVAYTLLNKLGSKVDPPLKTGDRVALVYPNNDPLSFMVAFHGCMLAGLVPVPLEVPLSKRDAGIQQLGFLLGTCSVNVALTSDACLKGLPKSSTGDVLDLKGWPKLTWLVTENLPKPPKDWLPPPRLTDETVAYIEYTSDREGSVKGVCVTRSSMLAHCRAITAACEYKENEVMVSVLDFKRETGLWHSIIASVFNGMHVIFIPYALMKMNPSSWMLMVTKNKACIGLVKSRDLHWGLLSAREHKDINLATLRMLIVADGANPWSLSSCDQFVSVFQQKGLKPDVLCPCAGSSETLTMSIRRPGRTGLGSSGRGVLSMSALSYGVVRVDQENSLTSLTLQDAGQVLPGATAVVVKLNGPPKLCKADEIGEICLYSHSTATSYWCLDGLTTAAFKVEPLGADDRPLGAVQYVRSGLIGFLGPGGLIFVCGTKNGLMHVSGRQHSADDVIATVLAVEPMKFVYRGRIVVFSIKVLRDERICIVAEQKPDVTEEESFQWMSRVLQAIDSIHQVGVYCLALVPPNHLPKTPLGGIHASDTRQKFLDGALHPTNLLMCPHTCITNLPKPREIQSDIGPAAMFVGNIVQGARIAGAQGRDLNPSEEDKLLYLADFLRTRAAQSPDHLLFTLINSKGAEMVSLTTSTMHRRAEKIGALLLERGHLNSGDHVALIYAPGVDLVCAFYGCLYVGMVPVCIRPPHPQNLQTTLPTVRMIVDVSKSVAILSTGNIIKLLRSKEASNRVDVKAWPTILDTDDLKNKRLSGYFKPLSPEQICYLDFSVSTTGMLAGIKMSFAGVLSLCKSLKLACELYPSRHVCLCLDPYCGLGFALWCLASIYAGHHSILIPPSEVELNPSLWLSTVSQYKVRDTFCSYGVMELNVRDLATQIMQLKDRGIQLSCVRTCVVVAEERPRVGLCSAFSKLFSPLGLSPRAVSTSFGCRVNVAICMQGASSPDPSTVYVDMKALRNDRVTLVEKGAPHSLPLMESGKLLPGVKVVIANPDTRGQCADSHLGEIWVSCPFNASGYFTVYGEETSMHDEHFNARLSTGDTRTTYARTGYLGFLRQTQSVTADGELHDALFVVGARDETMMLYGMRYHPVDIETSVLRAHRKICECAVFTWTNLLVVVAELEGPESEALDLVPLVTTSVLEDHYHIVGVVVVVDPGTVPINSRGEKQRMHLRDAFLHDQLDPIYVAYNM